MAKVALAMMWHQHQPYYPDDVGGENPMPWVRLHGTKDYIGMALHLEEVPEFRCTINLGPSLLLQIQAYADGGTDKHLRISRMPADGLARDDALYLLDNFFMAFHDAMIRPHSRYAELFQMRAAHAESAANVLVRFRERDIRDLQVWSNLAWFHPLLFEKDPELAQFKAKGRRYTESEKNWLLDKQRQIMGQIIPKHRKLAEDGQVELTTTPFFHPILPLLLDKRYAREAMPEAPLPAHKEGYPEDADVHVRRAVEAHEKHFGAPPKGMWPSEGSVCQGIIPLLAKHGLEWIATDEEILGCSTHGRVGRDSRGYVRNPDQLYRPWRVAEGPHELGIVFRDHALSDQIGFHYQRAQGGPAAHDFLGKIHGIGDACRHSGVATLVPVILDGENCWEYYPDGGVSFLRSLYQGAARDPGIDPVTVGEFLRKNPPTETLHRLFAGSWISHNFAIWIGHPEDCRAWDALHEARAFLVNESKKGRYDPADLARAWDEIYIAEGSDWFWWYGDDHSSALDALFDHLFRKHLRNVYELLDHEPPGQLFEPISHSGSRGEPHGQPTSFLRVRVDGRYSYFEWINAARYTCGQERGTMARVTQGPMKAVWFGFSPTQLLIRVDATDPPARVGLSSVSTLRVGFVDPADREVVVTSAAKSKPEATVLHREKPTTQGSPIEVACDRILELAVPFDRLELKPDDKVRFYIELLQGETSLDRAPREGIFETTVPGPDFERLMWQV